ncbi:hypothetical protein AB0D74_48410 [Streptomyces sp. NPDC048278]|uniref:hypothetical protein n=1 Tax=Streptomyces sp. NPDC048278 TaxID=3155809 RepID=UPI003448D6F6
MTTVQPNPYSPYATADPQVRHLFPTLFGPPTAGALLPTGCLELAVVPDEPLETDPAAELPAGVCPGCAAALRGIGVLDLRPHTACRTCPGQTRYNELCAVCRAKAHELWADTRVHAAPPPATPAPGPFLALGGPVSVASSVFCDHGDLAIAARLRGHHLSGDQADTTLDVIMPRCYIAKVIGAVLAVVDHDPSTEAQDRFAETVTETQQRVSQTLQERAARDENGRAL